MTDRVIHYDINDFAYGHNLNKIETIATPTIDSMSINDAIEYYQIKKYFDEGARANEWSNAQFEVYVQKSKALFQLSMRYINQLTDENLLLELEAVDRLYIPAFWELFVICKLHKRISSNCHCAGRSQTTFRIQK